MLDFFNSIIEENFIDIITPPDSKWKIVQISNISFYFNHLQDAPLKRAIELLAFIVNNRRLANVSAENSLCFFRCLAVFRGSDHRGCNRAAKELFHKYCRHFEINVFTGINLIDFIDLENFYQLNIAAYKLKENKAKLIQSSRELYPQTMKLSVYENHLSLIIDFEKCCHVYECVYCSKLWYQNCYYYRHTKTCTTTVRKNFPGRIHRNPYTIFKKLEQIGICVPK